MKQNASGQPSIEERPAPARKTVTASQKGDNAKIPGITVHTSLRAPDFRKKAPDTLPHTDENTKKVTPKKHIRRLHETPVTTLPEDDELEEVLDDVSSDTLIEELPIDAPEEQTTSKGTYDNLSRRVKGDPNGSTDPGSAEFEAVRKKSGFSEDDIAMLLELGYESELGRMVGYENVKQLKHEHNRRIGKYHIHHYRVAFGYRGVETVNAQNKDLILAAYVHDRNFLILRTILTAIATFLLFLLDFPQIFGNAYAAFDAAYPAVFDIFSLLILLGICILSWRQIAAGIRSYFKLRPTPYSTAGTLLFFTLIYDALAFFTSQSLFNVNCIVASMLLLLSLCDALRFSCEIKTVRLLGTDELKTVLEPTQPRKKTLRQGKRPVKIINDDIDERFYRVTQAQETTGFFRRFNAMEATYRPFHILLGLSPAVAFIGGMLVLLITQSTTSALSVFMTALMAAAPFGAIFGYFYPLCRANRLLAKAECALIGEEAIEEFSESKTIIFPDTDLFSAEKCTEISVRESDDFRRDLRLAGILFCKIGGTLGTVGATYGGRTTDTPVTLVRIAEQGVEAVVDEQYHMIAGSAEFLKKCGIRVARESTDKALRRTPDIGVMYVAIDGVLKLCYEVEYTEKNDFEDLVYDLACIDTATAIRSYDPNLNELFLHANRTDRNVPIRVIKPGRYEPDSVLKSSDTGAVVLGDRKNIVCPLFAAHGVKFVQTFGFYLQYIVSALGALAAIVFALLPTSLTGTFTVTPILVAAYHLGTVLLMLIVAACKLNRRSLHMRKAKKE